MMGYTSGSRLGVLLAKPARKIASYFAYPGTLRLWSVEYKIVSTVLLEGISDKYRGFYAEKLAVCPRGLQCYKPPPTLGPTHKIAHTGFRLCCFNNPQKFNDRVINVWAQILHKIPETQIHFQYFLYKSPDVVNIICRKFESRGIPRSRLTFGYKLLIESLRDYQKMDIALDPFPYNGGTISSEALYMNTPIITLKGNMYHSRVGEELLETLGLGELVAKTEDEYIAKVVDLYHNRDRLAWLHNNISRLMEEKGLIDSAEFVREGFEQVLGDITGKN
jgi:predicted O-linked N-acetylglucosamine transferase (SPINDLY family)